MHSRSETTRPRERVAADVIHPNTLALPEVGRGSSTSADTIIMSSPPSNDGDDGAAAPTSTPTAGAPAANNNNNNNNNNSGNFFPSTSPSDVPSLLHLVCPPGSNLGAVLVNIDKKQESEMFVPGYAIVGRLLEGDTVAKQGGVQPGDILVAVNGAGFRRFKPDYNVTDAPLLEHSAASSVVELDHAVVEPGTAYEALLARIKSHKTAGESLTLTFERYAWDARPNAWGRFLSARDSNVIEAMQMIQTHETWKASTFPIPLHTSGLQQILRNKAVSEIDIDGATPDAPPTVYVHYAQLLQLQTGGTVTSDDVVQAFVIFTERMLSKAIDPRHPKTTQFIDLTGVSVTSGFRVDTLKKIYNVFEPNYPETLHKMVMYPVSSMVVRVFQTMRWLAPACLLYSVSQPFFGIAEVPLTHHCPSFSAFYSSPSLLPLLLSHKHTVIMIFLIGRHRQDNVGICQ